MNKFTKEFKEKAINLKETGVHPNTIFEDEGFLVKDKQKDYATKLINKWRVSEPQSKQRSQEKRMEYLEAQVAYLKAENEFLKQLPKKKKN